MQRRIGEEEVDRHLGLPHADVDEHVRIERGDRLDDPIVLVGVDAVEDRTMEAMSRRIGIDSGQFTHPVLGFQQAGDRGTELSAHATVEHPFPTHHHER